MTRSRRDARGQNALGLVLVGLVLAALGAFALAGVLMRPPPTDPETLCRTDAPLAAHTIILLDSTDRLAPRHRRRLRAIADQERARLNQYERLTLMRIDPRRPQEPRLIFSKCLPRPPHLANPLFENPRLAQENWDASFASALEAAVRSAQSGGRGNVSPILDGVRAIAAEADFSAAIPNRRLVLLSDLLEHDPEGFSLYTENASFADWLAAEPSGAPDLSGVTLRLSPLDRPEHAARQAYALETFWPAYLDAAGAADVEIDPLP